MSGASRASFESVALQLAPAERPATKSVGPSEQGLHVCPGCDSKLVYPTSWEECPDNRWYLTLRCPECEFTSLGEFEQSAVDELELELERGDADLAADLSLFIQANMVDFVNRFVRAIGADAIQPMDF
ncbi:MAG TPA: hypothetical protein VF752_03435 [Thermoleophilaceae bacterium]